MHVQYTYNYNNVCYQHTGHNAPFTQTSYPSWKINKFNNNNSFITVTIIEYAILDNKHTE